MMRRALLSMMVLFCGCGNALHHGHPDTAMTLCKTLIKGDRAAAPSVPTTSRS